MLYNFLFFLVESFYKLHKIKNAFLLLLLFNSTVFSSLWCVLTNNIGKSNNNKFIVRNTS